MDNTQAPMEELKQPKGWEKVKKTFRPKSLMYASSILVILAMILLMTIPDLIIDPTRFSDQTFLFKWLTKCLILVGIEIPSMLIFEGMSRDYNKTKTNGLYQQNLDEYLKSYEKVRPIEKYFSDYYLWILPRESMLNRRKYLMMSGLGSQEAEYLAKYCELADLEKLAEGAIEKKLPNGKTIKMKRIEMDKIPFVKYALKGGVDVKDLDYSKYLYAESADKGCLSILQKYEALEKERNKITAERRTLKIVSMIIFSAIWAMVAFDSKQEGTAQVETWMNLASRLGAMIGGAFTGWTTSMTTVKFQADELVTKVKVLDGFVSNFNDKTFVPESYEEKAERELKEQAKKEQEAIEAVAINPNQPSIPLIENPKEESNG